jgi:hypothetical protein
LWLPQLETARTYWRERVVPIRNLLFGSGSKSPEQLLMLSDLSLLLLVRISGLASAVRISSNVAEVGI